MATNYRHKRFLQYILANKITIPMNYRLQIFAGKIYHTFQIFYFFPIISQSFSNSFISFYILQLFFLSFLWNCKKHCFHMLFQFFILFTCNFAVFNPSIYNTMHKHSIWTLLSTFAMFPVSAGIFHQNTALGQWTIQMWLQWEKN